MIEDVVDGEIVLPTLTLERRKAPSLEMLHNEMPCRRPQKKEFGKKALKTLFNRLRLRRFGSADISTPDPNYKVAYLGNVLTGWAKGDGCVEKPLSTLWRNYTQSSRPDVRMELTVSGGGLKAHTKDHGLTEYWAHRITFCTSPKQFPRLFCWVYRHEGRRLRHELRCHAVLCATTAMAQQIEHQLRNSLTQALVEFKKDKISRQNARLSLVNSVYDNPSMPRRKIMLSTGTSNYRPPLERSKSAPKLTMIEENLSEEDDENTSYTLNSNMRLLRHCDSTSTLIDKRKVLRQRLAETANMRIPSPIDDAPEDEECEYKEETADERSNRILENLVAEVALKEQQQNIELWFRPALDSDEGSLSSGCESASTATSEAEPQLNEPLDFNFKVGGTVTNARLELPNRKFSCMKHHHSLLRVELPDPDEVSLIPVGETQTDFSSLKVYKKRSVDTVDRVFDADGGSGSEGEADSACSDESGYSEVIEYANNEHDANKSPISKIVMV